jgi:choline-glycine betaine transporter
MNCPIDCWTNNYDRKKEEAKMGNNFSERKIRWPVFLPPWIIAAIILALNLSNYNLFIKVMDGAVGWILGNFSWLLSLVTCTTVIIVIIVYFSPLKDVRFGGSTARPLVSYPNFVWIVLCTIMGSGLMLWACAEPMFHLYHPPANVGAGPHSGEAVLWAMENILLEWTFTPMALYSLPSILFAFVFYNMKKPFTIGSMFSMAPVGTPASDKTVTGAFAASVDCVCLFALCMGMSASLGTGVLLVAGGLENISGGALVSNPRLWVICGAVFVLVFVISASTGLNRGIRFLSKANAWFYLILGLFVFIFGPTMYILDLSVESLGLYLSDFFKISLWTSSAWADGWARTWPAFYWCTWLAWMPVSVAFLGRISRGYTVRETLNVVFIIPSIFSVLWLVIFSGTVINFDLAGLGINDAMTNGGVAAATYALLDNLPAGIITVPLFLATAFLAYVTSAAANANAMAGLCSKGLSVENSEPPALMKIIWGVTIGALCIIMLSTYDIEGVKLLSYLGGFPVMFMMMLFMFNMIKIMRNPQKYDTYKEDYDTFGRPIKSTRGAPETETDKGN